MIFGHKMRIAALCSWIALILLLTFIEAFQTMTSDGKFHFAIDRGGTFTDVFCRLPNGEEVSYW